MVPAFVLNGLPCLKKVFPFHILFSFSNGEVSFVAVAQVIESFRFDYRYDYEIAG